MGCCRVSSMVGRRACSASESLLASRRLWGTVKCDGIGCVDRRSDAIANQNLVLTLLVGNFLGGRSHQSVVFLFLLCKNILIFSASRF